MNCLLICQKKIVYFFINNSDLLLLISRFQKVNYFTLLLDKLPFSHELTHFQTNRMIMHFLYRHFSFSENVKASQTIKKEKITTKYNKKNRKKTNWINEFFIYLKKPLDDKDNPMLVDENVILVDTISFIFSLREKHVALKVNFLDPIRTPV